MSPQTSHNIFLAAQVLLACLFSAMFLQAAYAVGGMAGASVLGLVLMGIGALVVLHKNNRI